jgi:hypothetical protein
MILIDRDAVWHWRPRLARSDRPHDQLKKLRWQLHRTPRNRAWRARRARHLVLMRDPYDAHRGVEVAEFFSGLRTHRED